MKKQVLVPDIGSFSGVSVIEILVKVGDFIAKEASLITLETDKATMEIPSPYSGKIESIQVKEGDKISEGDIILTLEVAEEAERSEKAETVNEVKKETGRQKAETEGAKISEPKASDPKATEAKVVPPTTPPTIGATAIITKPALITAETRAITTVAPAMDTASKLIHAGPAVRRFARELGVDLSRVPGTGRNGRIVISDVKNFVKLSLSGSAAGVATGAAGGGLGLNLPPWPSIDHAKFGDVTIEPLSRIKKLSGSYLHRNWVMVPHVTQFDEADITELEQFRKESQSLAEQQGIKLTPLVFIMKAVVASLKAFPDFNASLDASASQLILKKYFHLGVAVDTPNGLVVPVVRDVDQKGLFQLAKELGELSNKARKGQLTAAEMQGSSFSISSLGSIGGTAFTPIVNVPDVAILGVSKSQIKPIFQEGEFKPCLMLPLSLSYDHRVIDGAQAARFITYLVKQLSDIRRLLF